MKATKFFIHSFFIAVLFSAAAYADDVIKVGVVNFATCMEKSHLGKEETNKLESLRNEMIAVYETKQKEFQEVAEKLNNPDYLDTLTQDAEGELQAKAQNLSQELQIMGQQTGQALQQAEMKMYQSVKTEIDNAAAYIAGEKDFDFILNKDSCFYFKRPQDITPLVVKELNRHFQPGESSEVESQ